MIFVLKIVSKRPRTPSTEGQIRKGQTLEGVEGKGVFWDVALLEAFQNTLFPTTEGLRGKGQM